MARARLGAGSGFGSADDSEEDSDSVGGRDRWPTDDPRSPVNDDEDSDSSDTSSDAGSDSSSGGGYRDPGDVGALDPPGVDDGGSDGSDESTDSATSTTPEDRPDEDPQDDSPDTGGQDADDPSDAPSATGGSESDTETSQPSDGPNDGRGREAPDFESGGGEELTGQDLRAAAAAATSGSGEMARGTEATDFGAFEDSVSRVEESVEEQNPGLEAGEDFEVGINEQGEFTAEPTEEYRREQREQANEAIAEQARSEGMDPEKLEAQTGRDIDGDGDVTTVSEIVADQYESSLEEEIGTELSSDDVTTRQVTEDGETRVVGELTQSGREQVEEAMETSSFTLKVPGSVPLVGGLSQTITGQSQDVTVSNSEDGGLNVDSNERFGDIDWSFGLAGPGDEVEGSARALAREIQRTNQNVTNALFGEGGVASESAGEEVLDALGYSNLGDAYERNLENFGRGLANTPGMLASEITTKPFEAAEFGVEAASNPGGTAAKLPGAAAGTVAAAGTAAAKNPARTAGSLVGSLAGSYGLFKATQGTRLGTASRYALQPGEELLKTGVNRGVISQDTATKFWGVRSNQFEGDVGTDSSLSVRNAVSRATDRAGSAGQSIRRVGPDVSVVEAPNSGIFDVTPEARQEISNSLSVSPRETAADAKSSLAERIEGTRQRAAVEMANAELRRRDLAERVRNLSLEDAREAGQQAATRVRDTAAGTGRGALFSTEAALFNARRRLARDGDTDSDGPLLGPVEGRVLGAAASGEAAYRRLRNVEASDLAPSRPGFNRGGVPSLRELLARDRDSGDDPLLGPVKGRVLGAAASGEAAYRRLFASDSEGDSDPEQLAGPIQGRVYGATASAEAGIRRALNPDFPDVDSSDLFPSRDSDTRLRDLTVRIEPTRPPRTPFSDTFESETSTDTEPMFETGGGDGDATGANDGGDVGQLQGANGDIDPVAVARTETATETWRSQDELADEAETGRATEVEPSLEPELPASPAEEVPASESMFEAAGEQSTTSAFDFEEVTETSVGIESTGFETGVETGVETGTEIGIETGVETGVETGTETGVETGMETGMEMGMETEIGAEAPWETTRLPGEEEDDDLGVDVSTSFSSDEFDTGIASVEELEQQFDDPAEGMPDFDEELDNLPF